MTRLVVLLVVALGCGGSSSSGSRADGSSGDGSSAIRGGPPAPGIDAGLIDQVDARAADAPAAHDASAAGTVDAAPSLDVAPDVAPYACRRAFGRGCCLCKDPGGRGDTCCLSLDCGGKLCQGECYGVPCAGMCVPTEATGCTPSGEICGTWTSNGSQSAPYCSTCTNGDTAAARAAGLSCPAGGGPCALDQGRVCMCGSVGSGALTKSLPCCDQRCQS